ncbi:MAG: C40 family peptidase [Flavisolibacter sp.]
MIKTILSTTTILFLLGTAHPAASQVKQVSANSSKADVKFLDEISVNVAPVQATVEPGNTGQKSVHETHNLIAFAKPSIEEADRLQFKYSLLLDTEVEMLKNISLLKLIDEWFGTKYRLGGTTKAGIDCSAFMQVLFSSLYGVSLPRTAREQFMASHKISRTDLKEGDLVFFNTTGGISHVGMYLQNNKFVHASSSGVTISDLFDEYWVRRFVGARRMEEPQPAQEALSSNL